MNALTATATLPAILAQPNRIGRRRRIADFCPGRPEVDRFNRLLLRLGGRCAPLNLDQLASAARELCARSTPAGAPCIGQWMRRFATVSRMLADPRWTPADHAIAAAELVIAYVRGDTDLIPDRLRPVGRLDDAIVIEAAWPQLGAEVSRYLDFRRLLRIETQLRGAGGVAFAFTRINWEQARRAEMALRTHRRSVGQHSYLTPAVALFRIH